MSKNDNDAILGNQLAHQLLPLNIRKAILEGKLYQTRFWKLHLELMNHRFVLFCIEKDDKCKPVH